MDSASGAVKKKGERKMYIIKMITKSNQTKFYTINQAGKKAPISHWVIRDLIAAKVPVIIKQAVR